MHMTDDTTAGLASGDDAGFEFIGLHLQQIGTLSDIGTATAEHQLDHVRTRLELLANCLPDLKGAIRLSAPIVDVTARRGDDFPGSDHPRAGNIAPTDCPTKREVDVVIPAQIAHGGNAGGELLSRAPCREERRIRMRLRSLRHLYGRKMRVCVDEPRHDEEASSVDDLR